MSRLPQIVKPDIHSYGYFGQDPNRSEPYLTRIMTEDDFLYYHYDMKRYNEAKAKEEENKLKAKNILN